MKRGRFLLWVQGALWVLLAALVALAALDIYVTGLGRVAADPTASIYTLEGIQVHAGPVLAVLGAILAVALVCAALGGRPQEGRAPVRAVERPMERNRTMLGRVLLAAAVVLILAGVVNGSVEDVLVKAAMICTECVGLG